MTLLEKGFEDFLHNIVGQEETAEYLLPIFIDSLLKKNLVKVKVLETGDQWHGVTYKEDIPSVVQAIQDLIQKGVYAQELFSDLKTC